MKIVTDSPVIHIQISGLDMKPEALNDLVKTLEKSLPGKDKRVIVTVGSESKAGTATQRAGAKRLYRVERAEADKPVPAPKPPTPPARVTRPGSGADPYRQTLFGTPSSDKRIDGLEKKLDILLRELESIRREMRRAPRGGGGGAGGGAGGAGGGAGASPGGSGGQGGFGSSSSSGSSTAPGGAIPPAKGGN